ncbi:MAG: hypothetical protein JO026_00240, partial [Patescibacteria group bacterium]|nr:hypothetical protein [Patescibacteria group bacterium]
MRISKSQFSQLRADRKLVLSLIGMSNIGKTYRARKLAQGGFRHISCDDRITKLLLPAFFKAGDQGLADVSEWMGQPFDERFSENQKKYLAAEKEAMEKIFAEILSPVENTVIDTTGSIVHADDDIRKRLRNLSLVVYIRASERMEEEMFERYLKKPKPVVFGNAYTRKPDEGRMESLARSYKELLRWRSSLYAQ